jgi:hypothetical protein
MGAMHFMLLIAMVQDWDLAINFHSLTQGVVYQDLNRPYFFQVNGDKFRFGIPTAYPLDENNDLPQVNGIRENCSDSRLYCQKYGIYVLARPRKSGSGALSVNIDGVKININGKSNGDVIATAGCDEVNEKGCRSWGRSQRPYISYTYVINRAGYLKSIDITRHGSSRVKYSLIPKGQNLLMIR